MQLAARLRWTTSLTALAFVGGLMASPAEAAPTRGQLQSIELKDAGKASEWFAIVTDKPANFTSFKLSRPTRVVVDFPETSGSFRKAEGSISGPVAAWSIETLGAEEQVVTRLTVELREDVDYTLASNAGTIELRFVPATARPLTALEREPAAPVIDDRAAENERLAREQAAQAKLEEQRLAREKVEQERLTAEREKARVATEAKERARQEALAERLRKVQERREQAEREAAARREVKERAAAEKAERIAAKKAREQRLREAREAEKARQAEARAAQLAQERAAQQAREAERRQAAEARRAAAAIPSAILERVAFRRSAEGAELLLQLSAPVAHATREEEGRLILDLEHTKITVANNRRDLDTRFFGTGVNRIVPKEDREAARVSIVMELGSEAPYKVRADGTTIAVLFQKVPGFGEQDRAALTAVP